MALARKFLMAMILAFLGDYPRLQISGFMSIQFSSMAMMVYIQPYKKRKQNLVHILGQSFLLLATIFLFLLPMFEKYLTVQLVKFLSWASVFLFIMGFVL